MKEYNLTKQKQVKTITNINNNNNKQKTNKSIKNGNISRRLNS